MSIFHLETHQFQGATPTSQREKTTMNKSSQPQVQSSPQNKPQPSAQMRIQSSMVKSAV